jgi:hypothetical protein
MKLMLIVVTFFTLSVAPLVAQQKPRPDPPTKKETTVTPDLKRAYIAEVKVAILTAQLATAQSQTAAAQSQIAQMTASQKAIEAQALINSTQKLLGLDDTYAWDFQAMDYVKKPAK